MARVLDSVTVPIKKNGTKTNQNYVNNPKSIAPQFSASTAYAAGQYVFYDKKLYRFKVDHAAGAWNAAHAEERTVGKELTDLKQDFNEYHPDLGSGYSAQLLSTVFIEDEVPYNFRTAGGSADIGDREYDEIVGVSMPINQYVDKNTLPATTTVNGVTYTNNGDGSITVNGTATDNSRLDNIISVRTWLSHKYLLSGCPSGGSIQSYSLALRGQGSDVFDFGNGVIWDASVNAYKGVCIYVTSGTVNSLKFVPQFTDLTLILGATIADYVYGLEQSTAGSGVSWLKHHFPKIFDSGYIPYNAGEMQSVSGLSAHRMTGFNQWDEEWEVGGLVSGTLNSKNFIPVVPNTVYYMSCKTANTYPDYYWYDADKNLIGIYPYGTNYTVTIPEGCYYIKFRLNASYGTTYKNDICINLHWDGERDGEYEAYKEYVYPLDDSVVLRGKLELDSNNNLRANGDRYLPDGTVQRRYDVVDLGTLTWTYFNPEGHLRFAATLSAKPGTFNLVCTKYLSVGYTAVFNNTAVGISIHSDGTQVAVYDPAYTDAATFKTAMSGVYLVYELATPTTETAEAYQTPQIVDDWGTEEYVSTSLVPVGHYTKYANNLRAKLEMAPESPAGNGDYIVRQTNGENEYVALGSTTTIQNILDRLTALENA